MAYGESASKLSNGTSLALHVGKHPGLDPNRLGNRNLLSRVGRSHQRSMLFQDAHHSVGLWRPLLVCWDWHTAETEVRFRLGLRLHDSHSCHVLPSSNHSAVALRTSACSANRLLDFFVLLLSPPSQGFEAGLVKPFSRTTSAPVNRELMSAPAGCISPRLMC